MGTMRTVLGVGLAAALVCAGRPASAQTCTGAAVLHMGQPAVNATDVPTNVVPWLWGEQIGGDAVVTLRDVTGEVVPADVVWLEGYVSGEYVEIHPRAELAAGRFYDVLIEGALTDGGAGYYRFTTGSGPATGAPPSLPAPSMQVADNGSPSGCGEDTFACVGTTYAGTVRATVTDAAGAVEGEMLVTIDGALRYVRSAAAADSPFCVELRARDVAGRLGEPSTICSDDAQLFSISTASPVTCEGSRIVADGRFADEPEVRAGGDDGCAAAGRSPAADAWLVALIAWALRRRRGS